MVLIGRMIQSVAYYYACGLVKVLSNRVSSKGGGGGGAQGKLPPQSAQLPPLKFACH